MNARRGVRLFFGVFGIIMGLIGLALNNGIEELAHNEFADQSDIAGMRFLGYGVLAISVILAIWGFATMGKPDDSDKHFDSLALSTLSPVAKNQTAGLETLAQAFSKIPSLVSFLERRGVANQQLVENLAFKLILTTTHLIILEDDVRRRLINKQLDSMSCEVIRLEDITSLEISTKHHIQYAGYGSRESNFIVGTVNTSRNQRFTRLFIIGNTESEQNLYRPRIIEKLQNMSDWLPVIATGESVESSGGYITSTSIGFWQEL